MQQGTALKLNNTISGSYSYSVEQMVEYGFYRHEWIDSLSVWKHGDKTGTETEAPSHTQISCDDKATLLVCMFGNIRRSGRALEHSSVVLHHSRLKIKKNNEVTVFGTSLELHIKS